MERRQFLNLGLSISAGALISKGLTPSKAFAAGPALTDKDFMKEGKKMNVNNFCEVPKKGNKACPNWKEGNCKSCMFYNTDASVTTYKGKEAAKCQLQTEQPQYALATNFCENYYKKA